MEIAIKVLGVEYVNEISDYWTDNDYKELLDLFNFANGSQIKPEELREMLLMAITDFEPDEAAQLLLKYKLGELLNEGQINSLSHEMKVDKVAEEYPEPKLHFELYNINQLLRAAYNGIFPNTEASIIALEINAKDADGKNLEITNEILTKALSAGLRENSLLKRLYSDQLEGLVEFDDASKFIWRLKNIEGNKYELITSKYWISREDFSMDEFVGNVVFFEGGDK